MMITHGVEISNAGAVGEKVRVSNYTDFFFLFFSLFYILCLCLFKVQRQHAAYRYG